MIINKQTNEEWTENLNTRVEKRNQWKCFHTAALDGAIKLLSSNHTMWHVWDYWAADSDFLSRRQQQKIKQKKNQPLFHQNRSQLREKHTLNKLTLFF